MNNEVKHNEFEQKKSPISERSGVVAGATSTNGLNQTSNGHLCHLALTQFDSDAILVKNTLLAKRKIQKIINIGHFAEIKNSDTINNVIRTLAKKIGLRRSNSTHSFYGKYELNSFDGDLLVVDRDLLPTEKTLSVCMFRGEFALKRIVQSEGRVSLMAGNKKFFCLRLAAAILFNFGQQH